MINEDWVHAICLFPNLFHEWFMRVGTWFAWTWGPNLNLSYKIINFFPISPLQTLNRFRPPSPLPQGKSQSSSNLIFYKKKHFKSLITLSSLFSPKAKFSRFWILSLEWEWSICPLYFGQFAIWIVTEPISMFGDRFPCSDKILF